jgi:hypothetical protein
MQKFIFTTFLAAYFLAFFAPFALAADTVEMKFCEVDAMTRRYTAAEFETTVTEDGETWGETTTKIDEKKKRDAIDTWYQEEYEPLVNFHYACGTKNDNTQSLEKGDCSAEGKIITELTEFTPDSSTNLDEDNYVLTVYAGSCCLVGMIGTDNDHPSICDEDRTIYKLTYKECTDVAGNCSKRTWVIANSGANMLKLSVKYLYGWAAGIVGLVAVTTIVYNGIKISVSGISGDVSAAKDKIFQAIGSIVLLFLSGLLLYTINPTFFS